MRSGAAAEKDRSESYLLAVRPPITQRPELPRTIDDFFVGPHGLCGVVDDLAEKICPRRNDGADGLVGRTRRQLVEDQTNLVATSRKFTECTIFNPLRSAEYEHS